MFTFKVSKKPNFEITVQILAPPPPLEAPRGEGHFLWRLAYTLPPPPDLLLYMPLITTIISQFAQ